jgi:hypothetical protein
MLSLTLRKEHLLQNKYEIDVRWNKINKMKQSLPALITDLFGSPRADSISSGGFTTADDDPNFFKAKLTVSNDQLQMNEHSSSQTHNDCSSVQL